MTPEEKIEWATHIIRTMCRACLAAIDLTGGDCNKAFFLEVFGTADVGGRASLVDEEESRRKNSELLALLQGEHSV